MAHAHLRSAAKLLGYPLQPVPLIAIVFFTLGFALAAMAGMFGLPLFALLVVWLAKYVFIIVENSAQGCREPPVLSHEMINPFGESRHLLLLGVLAIYAGIAAWLGGMLGRDAMLLFLWAVALLLPASIALLTVEQRLLPALDPLRMLRLAAALRWRYALLWLAVAGCVSLPALAPLLIRQPLLLIVVWIYGVLLCAHAFGRVLYEGRDAIGLDVEIEPDRVLARLRRERWQRIERVLDEAGARRDRVSCARPTPLCSPGSRKKPSIRRSASPCTKGCSAGTTARSRSRTLATGWVSWCAEVKRPRRGACARTACAWMRGSGRPMQTPRSRWRNSRSRAAIRIERCCCSRTSTRTTTGEARSRRRRSSRSACCSTGAAMRNERGR